MAFTRMIIATVVAICVIQSSATPLSRLKRDDAQCRIEGLLVGGTVVGDQYLMNVPTEADCIAKCNELDKCTAVNYFPEQQACLPQEESYEEHKDSLETAKLEGTVYIIVKNCGGHPEKRSKRDVEAGCRKEGLMVGGTVINNEYIFDVASEADCVAKCNEFEKCTAVNYFPDYQACLPQEESLATHQESLHSAENPTTTYVIVKGCDGTVPEPKPQPDAPVMELVPDEEAENIPDIPEPERRKRSADCRKEKTFVGGTPVGEYILNIKTEADCIAECNKEETCTAVNYFPLHEACLPQVENLNTTPDLQQREEDITVYIIVKGCDGSVPEPAEEPEAPVMELVPDEETENIPDVPEQERRKRNADCRKEKTFVGGTPVGEYILNIKTEADCIAECNKEETCTAVNYFPLHEACLPQVENLNTSPDLQQREEDITNYIIVKGCGGTQPETDPTFPELPKPEEQ